jgi:hypothetical protein
MIFLNARSKAASLASASTARYRPALVLVGVPCCYNNIIGGKREDKWMTPAVWNIVGLVCTLVGVLLLFRYGMPYRVRTGGDSFLLLEGKDEKAKLAERNYDILGWVGMALIVLGTLSQIKANL